MACGKLRKKVMEALAECEAVLSQLQDEMPLQGPAQDIMAQGYTGAAIAKARAVLAKEQRAVQASRTTTHEGTMHLINENGQEMEITHDQAQRLLALDLIYHCPQCGQEYASHNDGAFTVYHHAKTADTEVREDAHWREIESAIQGPDADTPRIIES